METSYCAQFHTSAEAEAMFAQVFGGRLGFCGFEVTGPRKWVLETRLGFKFLFHLHPQHNGVAYLPCGAISMDFVPRLVAGRFKIQPKPKNVAVHFSFGQKTRWDWMIDKPVMVLAYSFALARIHRIADARAEFERVVESKFYGDDLLPELRGLFEAEVQSSKA